MTSKSIEQLQLDYDILMREYRIITSLFVTQPTASLWDMWRDSPSKYVRARSLYARAKSVVMMDRIQTGRSPGFDSPFKGDLITPK